MKATVALVIGVALLGCRSPAVPEPVLPAEAPATAAETTPRRFWCPSTSGGSELTVAAHLSSRDKPVWIGTLSMVPCPTEPKWIGPPAVCVYGDNPDDGTGSGGCVEVESHRAEEAEVKLSLNWDLGGPSNGACEESVAIRMDLKENTKQLACGLVVTTHFRLVGERSNSALSPTHSAVTALAQSSKCRAAGRAG